MQQHLATATRQAAPHVDPPPDYSSSAETDRKSDKSESERSDYSTASTATRSRRDESRQQETVSKLIRQNALHCLIELNTRHCRWLVSRWNVLLPDQPAPTPSSVTPPQSSATPRFTASAEEAFSLCTLITRDPSTSVRVAATSLSNRSSPRRSTALDGTGTSTACAIVYVSLFTVG